MLFYLLRHFLEQRLLSIQRDIEYGLFELGKSVIVAIEVVLQDEHSLTIFL